MVNPRYLKILNKTIKKELKKVIAGDPIITTIGSPESQYKGLIESLISSKLEYQAHEFVHAKIPVKNQLFSFIDLTTPVVNIKKSSLQGVATFNTVITYPINETYVLKLAGFSWKLVPHSLAIEKKVEPKKIIKGGMITSKAIMAINSNKKLCKKLKGNHSCSTGGMFSTYTCSIDVNKYPPGMFTIVPYHGHSILIAKDAGINIEACANEPRYHIKDRYEALAGVANYIATHPQTGEIKGKFYLDRSMFAVIPIIENIKKNNSK